MNCDSPGTPYGAGEGILMLVMLAMTARAAGHAALSVHLMFGPPCLEEMVRRSLYENSLPTRLPVATSTVSLTPRNAGDRLNSAHCIGRGVGLTAAARSIRTRNKPNSYRLVATKLPQAAFTCNWNKWSYLYGSSSCSRNRYVVCR